MVEPFIDGLLEVNTFLTPPNGEHVCSEPDASKIEDFSWGRPTHPRYSPDRAPSDRHPLSSVQHFLSEDDLLM